MVLLCADPGLSLVTVHALGFSTICLICELKCKILLLQPWDFCWRLKKRLKRAQGEPVVFFLLLEQTTEKEKTQLTWFFKASLEVNNNLIALVRC